MSPRDDAQVLGPQMCERLEPIIAAAERGDTEARLRIAELVRRHNAGEPLVRSGQTEVRRIEPYEPSAYEELGGLGGRS